MHDEKIPIYIIININMSMMKIYPRLTVFNVIILKNTILFLLKHFNYVVYALSTKYHRYCITHKTIEFMWTPPRHVSMITVQCKSWFISKWSFITTYPYQCIIKKINKKHTHYQDMASILGKIKISNHKQT